VGTIVSGAQERQKSVEAIDRCANYRQYFVWLALPCFLIYVCGFLIVRANGYDRWSGNSWGSNLDYAFHTAGENADVVIFGDSSALLAVDPLELSRQLRLKVVNLPNTIGSLPVVGDMGLRHYLATNRPPRLIIFYFTAWDLDYTHQQGTRIFEGEEMLAKHGSWRQIADFGFHHPREVLYFPFRVFSNWSIVATLHGLRGSRASSEVYESRGHVKNDLPFPALSDACSFPSAVMDSHGMTTIRQLQTRYTSSQTATMLYLAPVPRCENVNRLIGSVKERLASPPPAVLPAGEFTADSYYAHLRPNAVDLATTQLGDTTKNWLSRR
jgi:hypothetical protein